jgi:hypothetical protein
MAKFWIVEACRPSHYRLISAPAGGPVTTYCDIENESELHAAVRCLGRPRTLPLPVARLKITREDFAADCFSWNLFLFVSEDMRRAMAFDPSQVRFYEVDSSASAALPRSKTYQIMDPAVSADVSDLERSVYRVRQFASGRLLKMIESGQYPKPDRPMTLIEADRIAFRPDAASEHDLFCDRFFDKHIVCTNDFATRILKARLTGMRFIDPMTASPKFKRRYRTLRGLEEHVAWNFKRGTERTRVLALLNKVACRRNPSLEGAGLPISRAPRDGDRSWLHEFFMALGKTSSFFGRLVTGEQMK